MSKATKTPIDERTEVGKLLETKRLSLGLSQTAMAQLIGMPHVTYRHVITAGSELNPLTVAQIEEVLSIPYHDTVTAILTDSLQRSREKYINYKISIDKYGKKL